MQDVGQPVELGVSEFVALLNKTLEYAYPNVTIIGELANLRVSKNRWVYFDLKDELSTVKFFGTVYQLPGPLEDGMLLKVKGTPKLHNLYGFSVNVQSIQPAGEGSIRRAADLLKAKLAKEGLFDDSRKRALPYPPQRIGLVTSKQSAAYADFIKIINARWQGVNIELIDVQVQGEPAPAQIAAAIDQFNAQAEPPEVLILIRGGGSAEDLAAFSSEIVTRAVVASRTPTLVAIGHEVDLSLAELAADQRASTPSNAAELLVPDRKGTLEALQAVTGQLEQLGNR
ncbi:MAG TPA: exodeoxyribonuclease VII large subunit, partial [Methylomirabilota bacterium]|nr:exodeoxyribonuclease VII large subunit [Methylomirabilota bacterium]